MMAPVTENAELLYGVSIQKLNSFKDVQQQRRQQRNQLKLKLGTIFDISFFKFMEVVTDQGIIKSKAIVSKKTINVLGSVKNRTIYIYKLGQNSGEDFQASLHINKSMSLNFTDGEQIIEIKQESLVHDISVGMEFEEIDKYKAAKLLISDAYLADINDGSSAGSEEYAVTGDSSSDN